MKKLDPFVFPLVPTLLAGFPVEEGRVYYVGDGFTFAPAVFRGDTWQHARADSPSYGKAIDIDPRYVLCTGDLCDGDRPAGEPKDRLAEAEQRGQWDCGNGHLADHLTLLLIERNRIRDEMAMETIAAFAHNAGPAFCSEMIEDLRPANNEVPF